MKCLLPVMRTVGEIVVVVVVAVLSSVVVVLSGVVVVAAVLSGFVVAPISLHPLVVAVALRLPLCYFFIGKGVREGLKQVQSVGVRDAHHGAHGCRGVVTRVVNRAETGLGVVSRDTLVQQRFDVTAVLAQIAALGYQHGGARSLNMLRNHGPTLSGGGGDVLWFELTAFTLPPRAVHARQHRVLLGDRNRQLLRRRRLPRRAPRWRLLERLIVVLVD
jgi:hypothetical protein